MLRTALVLVMLVSTAQAQAPYEPPKPNAPPPSAPPPTTPPYQPPGTTPSTTSPPSTTPPYQPPGTAPPPSAPPAEPPAPVADRKLFSIEATLGVYNGFGLGIRLGNSRIGGHLLATWQPLLIASTGEDALTPNLDFFSSLQASADLYFIFAERTTVSFGITGGYKFNNLLGHGAGLGFYAEFIPRRTLSFFLMAGAYLFPKGEERLRSEFPPGTEFSFPGPGFGTGANFGLMFSP